MKKFVLFAIVLLVSTLAMFSQTPVPPEGWSDLYQNYDALLSSYMGVAGISMFVGEVVIRVIKVTVKWQKVTVVFGVAILVSFISNGINVGYLAQSTWYDTILWGLLSGVAANGLFSSNLLWLKSGVQYLSDLIKTKT